MQKYLNLELYGSLREDLCSLHPIPCRKITFRSIDLLRETNFPGTREIILSVKIKLILRDELLN